MGALAPAAYAHATWVPHAGPSDAALPVKPRVELDDASPADVAGERVGHPSLEHDQRQWSVVVILVILVLKALFIVVAILRMST